MSGGEIERIIAGGQTGVDRAALDVALALGVTSGGWCPARRQAEDGVIPHAYRLIEAPQRDGALRTEWNVRDSDATLIFSPVPLTGGTALTLGCAERYHRPFRVFDPFRANANDLRQWLEIVGPRTLNVAGPRESSFPGIYRKTYALMLASLERSANQRS